MQTTTTLMTFVSDRLVVVAGRQVTKHKENSKIVYYVRDMSFQNPNKPKSVVTYSIILPHTVVADSPVRSSLYSITILYHNNANRVSILVEANNGIN